MGGTRSLFLSLDRRLRDECGLSLDDFGVLAAIERASEIRMSDLADLVSFSPSRLTHTVQRMETTGWVRRRPTEADGRVKVLSLTAKGRTRLNDAWPAHAEAIKDLFIDQLASGDRTVIDETFTRIRDQAGS